MARRTSGSPKNVFGGIPKCTSEKGMLIAEKILHEAFLYFSPFLTSTPRTLILALLLGGAHGNLKTSNKIGTVY